MWVIFEGLDKAGKGTLEWGLHKATNFKHIIVDRGPIGYLVFDKIFNRSTKDRDEYFIKQAEKVMSTNDFFVVYCKASKEIVEERLKAHNEICSYDYEKAQTILCNSIRKFYNQEKTLELDTSNKTIDECIKIIVDKIKKWEEGLVING